MATFGVGAVAVKPGLLVTSIPHQVSCPWWYIYTVPHTVLLRLDPGCHVVSHDEHLFRPVQTYLIW